MTSPIMEAAGRDQLSLWAPLKHSPSPYLLVLRVPPVLIPILFLTSISGKKKPKSCESASLVLQNTFWKCLCAGMPTRKFERDPAS